MTSKDYRLAENGGIRQPERRAPTAATRNVSYDGPGQPMVPEWDAEQAIRWAYIANVFVYRCVQVIARAVASVPFRAGPDPDRPEDWRPDAPLARLLGPPPDGPAPRLSARRLWAWTVAQYLVTGRFGWELELESRQPTAPVVALWPLPSSSLRAVPTQSGSDWFSRFEFGKPEDPRVLQPWQVVYAWQPSARDFRQPESVLQAARLDVSVAVMQERYDYGFLKNNARPATAVVTEAFENDNEYRAFKEQWSGEYAGPDNAGKPVFIEAEGGEGGVAGALDVKSIGLSQRDAEFAKRYEAKVRAICVAFGTPISKLGDASERTFANAGQEDTNWWQDTILPLLTDLQDEINMQLAPRVGDEVGWFDTSRVEALAPAVPWEPESASSLVASGIVTRDEVRERMGLPDLPESEFVPEPAAGGTQDEGGELDDGADGGGALPPGARSQPPPPPAQPQEDPAEVRRARVWKRADAQARALETVWERAFARLFERQAAATISRLEGKRGRQLARQLEDRDPKDPPPSTDQIFDRAHWTNETEDLTEDLYSQVYTASGGAIAERFGVDFDLDAPHAQRWIARRVNQLAGPVTDTTYRAVKQALAEGAAEGEGIPKIAARVRDVFADAGRRRSTVIARTEVISAYNGSALDVAQSLPESVVGAQEWIATKDGRTRETHQAADGQAVRVGEKFQVGAALLDHPGDPLGPASETVQCRCTLAFLTPDEAAKAGIRRRTGGEVRSVVESLVERLAA